MTRELKACEENVKLRLSEGNRVVISANPLKTGGAEIRGRDGFETRPPPLIIWLKAKEPIVTQCGQCRDVLTRGGQTAP